MATLQLVEYKQRMFSTAVEISKKTCVTPASVPSERLFSNARQIYSDRHSRLAPERAEALLYMKNNFHLAGNT